MLVYHYDARREYAYGLASGLPQAAVGTFSESPMTEAKTRARSVISMKNDWRRVSSYYS